MSAIDTANVTGHASGALPVCRPASVVEVQEIVRAARREGRHLYPYSTGMNWGYGSKSPVKPGALLVDLSRMNSIRNAREISRDNPVAVIEAGVTQAQLYDFLQERCPGLTFNVTGAARASSVLGNSLDRGVGYFGPRRDDVFGMEIVTGTGDIVRTGFRRLGEDSPLAHSHPFGLGPMLDGLFFQSNFGIVTSACFRLVPRRPKEVAISMALTDVGLLAAFIDEVARLKRDGLLTSVTHIGNKARTQATLTYGAARYFETQCGYSPEAALTAAARALSIVAPSEWASLAAITGNAGQVRAAIREIRRRIGFCARVLVVTERRIDVGYRIARALSFIPQARLQAAALDAIRPLHALALGVPTDIAIDNLLWKFGRPDLAASRLDESNCGLVFINPALPLDGKAVVTVIRDLENIAKAHQHILYMTLNIETTTSMVAVINVLFNRSVDGEVERAHHCADAMLRCIRGHGLEVYRARVDTMKDVVNNNDYWRTMHRIKDIFDPDGIISPGRYSLIA